ncbi:hypothetical protein OE88DRAFT_1668285 [Heliocybe sulcata]|uniref:Uncharacterized protein n=1 Tax=Heliocybe sulcata TaxID=5364 RepID=A0A5C3MP25_9AGAM|nr:hypothetical protein OE88DRAFT_1668285 [Heliocybe sulcata]
MRYEVVHGSGIKQTQVDTTCKDGETKIKVVLWPKNGASSNTMNFTLRISSQGQRAVAPSAEDGSTVVADYDDRTAYTARSPGPETISRRLPEVDVQLAQGSLTQPPPYPGIAPQRAIDNALNGPSNTKLRVYTKDQVEELLNYLRMTGEMPAPFSEPPEEKSPRLPGRDQVTE